MYHDKEETSLERMSSSLEQEVVLAV